MAILYAIFEREDGFSKVEKVKEYSSTYRMPIYSYPKLGPHINEETLGITYDSMTHEIIEFKLEKVMNGPVALYKEI